MAKLSLEDLFLLLLSTEQAIWSWGAMLIMTRASIVPISAK